MNEKVALVTGGTSGIGKEIVKQLLKNGCFVFVNYGHSEETMYNAKKEFKEISNKFKCLKADVSNEYEVYAMFEKINEKFGNLDYLVNNAGINTDNFIEELDINGFRKIVNVNLIGKVIVTKFAIPYLKKSKSPCIVNIASRLGIKPCIEASAYCASEAGVLNFTKACALELSKYHIRVNSVSPGLTNTPLALKGWTEEEIKENSRSKSAKLRIFEKI